MIRCTAPRIGSSLRKAASPHVRWIATSRKACDAQFDIFAKLKDPPGETDTSKRRKPSDRVLHLVDEILSLTLIEAADLCDLCQDKLSPGNGSVIPGRMPFPHPGGMFAMPGMMPGMGAPTGAPSMPAPQAAPAAPAAAPAADDAAPVAKPAEEKKIDPKAPVTIKLMSFEASKKISVIKEVRAITALGLKESKELVEAAPKILKKGVPRDEAEALVEKLKAATGVVEFI